MKHSRVKPALRRTVAGFAILWILLVVALLGLGLTAAVRVEATDVQRDRERALLSIGRQFRNAIASYYESQVAGRSREYPASLDDLLKDGRVPGVRRHLRQVFIDPMTGKAEWDLVIVGGRIAGVRSMSNAVPIKQAGFEAEDMGFAGKQKVSEWAFTYPSDLLTRPDAGAMPAPAASAVRTGDRP